MGSAYYTEDLPRELFNWTVYLALVKERRLQLGYRDAKAFARTIYLRTRVSIPGETYYKIERGKQPLKAMQFMALNIALWGKPWPEKVMNTCMGESWKLITGDEETRNGDWIAENAAMAGLPMFTSTEAFDAAFSEGVRAGKFREQDRWLYDTTGWDWSAAVELEPEE